MTRELSDDGKILFAVNQSLLNLVRKDLFLVNVSWNDKKVLVSMMYQDHPDLQAKQICRKVKANIEERISGKEVEVYAIAERKDLLEDSDVSRDVFAVYTYPG